MARRVTGQQLMENMKSNTNQIDFNDLYVKLKADASNPESKVRLRLIGLPIEFYEAQPRVYDPENPGRANAKEKDFPDAHLNKKFTRICADDPNECPWTKMGYVKNKRYAINVIDKTDSKNPKVRILTKGPAVFGEFYKEEQKNREENEESVKNGEEPELWEVAGGEVTQDVIITVTYAPKKIGKVEYSVRFTGKAKPITEEEIEMLRAVHAPTADELKAIRKANPDLKDCPDWFFYGYDLEKWFKPDELKSEEAPTDEDELEVDVNEDEEVEVDTDEDTTEDTEEGSEDLPKLW